ncbi:MAG: hypothetical protein ACT4RN_06775 [Pseudonocardia sp.]
MIRTEIQIIVRCDRCATGMTGDADTPAGAPAVFGDRVAALTAIEAATAHHGWARRLEGRLLCPTCADRAICLMHGHEFRDVHDCGPHGTGEDGTGGWRPCACDRSIPAHSGSRPDPAGGPGCGMEWRLCGRCDHIDERHLTDLDEVQPGGHLRQDVPAGLALPTDDPSIQHESREETAMVERLALVSGRPTRVAGARQCVGRTAFRDRDSAAHVGAQLNRRVSSAACRRCGGWHLTRGHA